LDVSSTGNQNIATVNNTSTSPNDFGLNSYQLPQNSISTSTYPITSNNDISGSSTSSLPTYQFPPTITTGLNSYMIPPKIISHQYYD
jgi:hypothetical protein